MFRNCRKNPSFQRVITRCSNSTISFVAVRFQFSFANQPTLTRFQRNGPRIQLQGTNNGSKCQQERRGCFSCFINGNCAEHSLETIERLLLTRKLSWYLLRCINSYCNDWEKFIKIVTRFDLFNVF